MTSPTLRQRAGSDVATRDETPRPPTLADQVEAMRPQIARVLPKHLGDADRMARLALTVLRKTPQLAECDSASFLGALMTASQLGLELGDGEAAEAYVVPHRNKRRGTTEATLIIKYTGYAKLFYQSPMARGLDVQRVRENDEFDYQLGSDPWVRFKKAFKDRGEIVCYYATATLVNGATAVVVMTPDEVREIRGGKVGPSGDIKDPQGWMERKVVLKQLLKLLPKSATLAQAMNHDEAVRTDPSPDAIDRLPAPLEIEPPAGADVETGEMASNYDEAAWMGGEQS